jgi:hypothetical protein
MPEKLQRLLGTIWGDGGRKAMEKVEKNET